MRLADGVASRVAFVHLLTCLCSDLCTVNTRTPSQHAKCVSILYKLPAPTGQGALPLAPPRHKIRPLELDLLSPRSSERTRTNLARLTWRSLSLLYRQEIRQPRASICLGRLPHSEDG